jgi:hypothetical protein
MTTTTLRPNGTVAAGTVTGAANAHTALNDDSDSSYVAGNGANGTLVEMGTVAMGSGAVTKSARIRARAWHTSASGQITAASSPAGPSLAGTVSTANGILTFAGGYSPVGWSQASVDALRLQVSAQPVSANVRFYELYLDLIYVTQPVTTVTAVSPDPYTATNIIPIAWSNTLDADGDGQTRYEVKVYTDAQYGAGGFDPDTSDSYWESGEVVGSALTVNTGALATGDTYRAYVRVAQTVNGASHWSAWAFDTFAVDVDTADVDTVTATGGDAGGRIQIDVTHDGASEAWELIEVQRSIDAGVTWTPVRFANYVDCTADANDFQVFDYEVPNGTTALYRARATLLLSGLPVTGAWVQSTPAESWSSTECWLKSPTDPSLNTTFCMSRRDVYAKRRRTGRFDIIGAAAPIVVSDVMSSHSGMLTIETYGTTDAADLRALLEDTPVVLVQFPAAMDIADFYAAINGVDEVFMSANSDNLWRLWSATYDSVTAPADSTAGQ